MKVTDLPTPGIVPNGQKLLIELTKTINFLQSVAARSTAPAGKTAHADKVVATLTAALALANAVKVGP